MGRGDAREAAAAAALQRGGVEWPPLGTNQESRHRVLSTHTPHNTHYTAHSPLDKKAKTTMHVCNLIIWGFCCDIRFLFSQLILFLSVAFSRCGCFFIQSFCSLRLCCCYSPGSLHAVFLSQKMQLQRPQHGVTWEN